MPRLLTKASSPQTTKIGELYANLAKEAFKPVESAIAKVQSAASVTPK